MDSLNALPVADGQCGMRTMPDTSSPRTREVDYGSSGGTYTHNADTVTDTCMAIRLPTRCSWSSVMVWTKCKESSHFPAWTRKQDQTISN